MSKFKDPTFKKLMEYCKISSLKGFEEAYIKDSKIKKDYDENNEIFLSFTIVLTQIPDWKKIQKLKNLIKEIGPNFIFNFEYETNSYHISQKEVKNFYLQMIKNDQNFEKLSHLLKELSHLEFNTQKGRWIFNYKTINLDDQLDLNILNSKQEMIKWGFVDFDIDINHMGGWNLEESIKVEKQKVIENFVTNQEKQTSENQNNNFEQVRKKALSDGYQKQSYKNTNFEKVVIQYINNLPSEAFNIKVNFDAMIYKKEVSNFGNNYYYHFFVTDLKEATKVTVRAVGAQSTLNDLKENDWVNISGEVKVNSFDSSKYVQVPNAKYISPISSKIEKRSDFADRTRIELSTRSKMNTMDSILSASDIVNIAKNFEHSAVAIIDSNSVQSFPEFTSAAKKAGIKPIYGVSFDVIKKNNNAILTPKFVNVDLAEASVVSFDIETTHLSPRIGDIIEFGGSLVEKGTIKETYQFFMKAKAPLSAFTSNLTNITDQMLAEEGMSEKEGLEKIYQILNNKIALAHNANFDMHFILQKFIDHNMELPNTIFIDSLVISRLIFKDKAKHALGDFCRNLGVDYNSEVAHRANYDAEVLAKAWATAIYNLKDLGIVDLETLYNYEQTELREKTRSSQISVLVRNQKGLKELFELTSLTLTQRYFKSPKLFWEDLPKDHENLLIGSGGLKSELIDALLYSSDLKLNELIQRFDYIEVPHPDAFLHYIDENDFTYSQILKLLKLLIQRAQKFGKTVVAIGDVRYENQNDQIFYKSLVYSKGIGNTAHFLFNYGKAKADTLKIPQLYFPTTDEMLDKFSFLKDQALIEDIVINNTHKIANLIDDNIIVIHDKLYTPKFDDSHIKLKELVYQTAHQMYGNPLPKIIKDRLEQEINPILEYGFDVIYWISHILVKKSNDSGYLVGSRGSVGSSLVATMAGITEVNPLPPHYVCPQCKHFELANIEGITSGFDLDDKTCNSCQITMIKDGQTIPFETFLGFKADKVPDIDLNFSGEFQPEVHNEVKRLFGDSHTLRAGTISTIKSKTGFGYIKKACEEYGFTYSNNFIDFLSTKIEGVKRTTGQHPGGIIIIPKEYDVAEFTPINYPADDISLDWKTTHFDFHAIHDNVLKLDLLGHLDPTAIRMLEKLTGLDVKKDVPKKDPKVLSLFYETDALGISPQAIGGEITGALGLPEFGTNFVRKMLYEAKPTSFADLISLSGLSHGTDVWSNNAQELIKNQGMTIKDVISCRDDIMVYLINKGVDPLNSFKIMEQVRKGKSITPEQEEELKKFNVPSWYIESMKKIKYMFPKAHATAYVLMAWRIAWFKLYHPLAYYATFFTTRVQEFDVEVLENDFGAKKINAKLKELDAIKNKKVNDKELIQTLEIARELYARGFKISKINLEKSLANEWVIDAANGALIPPFASIKGIGVSVAEKIVQAREESDFRSKEDFKKRSTINSTLFKTIDELGVLESLNETDQMTLF